MTEAQRKASRKYEATNTVQIKLKLNKNTDSNVLERLNAVLNKQGYIKQLIREDLKRG